MTGSQHRGMVIWWRSGLWRDWLWVGSRSESERIFGETCAGSSLAARDLKGFHVTRIIRALTSYMLQKLWTVMKSTSSSTVSCFCLRSYIRKSKITNRIEDLVPGEWLLVFNRWYRWNLIVPPYISSHHLSSLDCLPYIIPHAHTHIYICIVPKSQSMCNDGLVDQSTCPSILQSVLVRLFAC